MLAYLHYIEIIGAIFGLICVVLAAKENIWCWPTGMISVIAYLYFYFVQTLYVTMTLHIIFLGACALGWYQWLYGGENKTKLSISNTKKKDIVKLIGLTIIGFLLFGYISDKATDDKKPYLDALLSSISLTAQWMMNNKLTESWLLWIVVDIAYATMHFQSKQYPSFIMYAGYIIPAIIAFYQWKKSAKKAELPL